MSAANAVPVMIDNRYILQDRLGSGGMGTVYLAHDLLTRQQIAIKHLTTTAEKLQFHSRTDASNLHLALAQEFRTLATLRHPHIISVYDFGFDKDNLPYYTMEYLPEAQDIVTAGKNMSFSEKVTLAIEMLQAIKYLHRRGILHRDLKPDNVLVVDNRVHVMDFGLAIETKTAAGRFGASDVVAGTVAYMSPELFQGNVGSKQADLWAVGVILYELLIGRYPFNKTSITALIMAIIEDPVDFKSVYDAPRIFAVLLRLLEKKPQDRYEDANQVIIDLAKAADQPLPPETHEIRESYLKASHFVGREQEMTTLKGALEKAQTGAGSGWLIGGESGVGKSRLLEEVRISAMVDGFWVLQGQATTEAGTPYELWREPLRKLCLRAELSEEEAGILKGLIPDIEELLGQTVPEPPEVDEQSAQARLMAIIDSMFRQPKQPMLLLFEDIQWAKDGIGLLSYLAKLLHELPLIIVATFRDEESPDLASRLPNMQLLSLKRLDFDTISQLATSILGPSAEQEHVIDFLHRETEGNVYFLIEAIRVLAEQSGRLDQIGQETLPRSIFAQGIYTIIQHRLAHVSVEDRPYLNYASVIGRGIDLAIMAQTFPELDVEAWLLRLGEVNILEVNNNHWRFAHDKLREVLLAELMPQQLQGHHASIADALEQVYPTSQSGLLAYHLERSLDLMHPEMARMEKAIFAMARAADLSLKTFAHNQAMELYRRVLDLEKIHRQWAAEGIDHAAALPETQVAAWHVQLATAQFMAFMYSDTKDNLEIALKMLDQPVPTSTGAVGRGILQQVAQQLLHRLFPGRYLNHVSDEMQSHLKQVAEIMNSIGTAYYMTGNSLNSLYTSLGNLNINERLGPSGDLAQAYAQMCLIAGSMGLRRLADYYYNKAIETLPYAKSSESQSGVYILTSVYYIGQMDYKRVREDTLRSIDILMAHGNSWGAGYSRQIYALTFYGEGDYDTAYRLLEEILQLAQEKRSLQHGYTAYTWLARIDLVRGHKEAAMYKIEQGLIMLQELQSKDQSVVDPWALAAQIFCHNGAYERAYQATEIASKLAVENRITGQWGKHAFPALIDAYLTLRDHTHLLPVDAAQLLEKAKKSLRSLLTLPDTMGKIMSYHSAGRIAYAEGKKNRAYKAWQQGIAEAKKRGLPLEEARCHRALGEYLPTSNPHKKAHQQAAIEILTRLNARFYLTDAEV